MDNLVANSATHLELQTQPVGMLATDLQSLEIETFQVESLEGLGIDADLTVVLTSSTTSSSCG